MKTVAVIPTRYEPDRLHRLLRIVAPDVDQVLVYDNGHTPPLRPRRNVRVIDARGMGLYAMWNAGWREALDGGPVNVAILNDDVRVLPGTLALLAKALRQTDDIATVYPDRHVRLRAGLPSEIAFACVSRDPVGSRDMTGYCFMFKAELLLPAFDEGYHWWYGDTQFDEGVRLAGYGIAEVAGLPIEHRSDMESTGWTRRPELKALVEEDGQRWARLHAEIRDGRWVPA